MHGWLRAQNPTKNQATKAFTFTSAQGAQERTLDIELATYLQPDHIKISAVDAQGATYPLLDICRMQTADYADPTDGCSRPADDSLRQYQVKLKAGTTSITFDFTDVCSPIYLRVLGLCDFNVTPFFPGCGFRSL